MVTRGYKGLQDLTKGYMGLQEVRVVKKSYKGSLEVTRC